MPFPPTDKSLEGLLKQTESRLTLVERRVATGGGGGAPSQITGLITAGPGVALTGTGTTATPYIIGTWRGTTAQRDTLFGVPGTVAAQVALANQLVVWFNTSKGYGEAYYAPTGSAGLTVRGLLAGYPAGWYPVAGTALTATRIKESGFQAIVAATITYPNLLAAFLVNIGGFTGSGQSIIIPPIGGYYSVTAMIYYSGAGAMSYISTITRFTGGAEIAATRIPGSGGADNTMGQTTPFVPVPAGQGVELVGSAAAAHNFYGDGATRKTFLTLAYDGPPLVNG
jgi:hypothetical protein